MKMQVLTYHKDFYQIKSGRNRRLYEIARKHVGKQSITWLIKLPNLYKKMGVGCSIGEFRRYINKLIANNELLEYVIFYNKGEDLVSFKKKSLL